MTFARHSACNLHVICVLRLSITHCVPEHFSLYFTLFVPPLRSAMVGKENHTKDEEHATASRFSEDDSLRLQMHVGHDNGNGAGAGPAPDKREPNEQEMAAEGLRLAREFDMQWRKAHQTDTPGVPSPQRFAIDMESSSDVSERTVGQIKILVAVQARKTEKRCENIETEAERCTNSKDNTCSFMAMPAGYGAV